jgi:NADH-quinone oxidoreductase subunit J
MDMFSVLFYTLALILIGGAVAVVVARNPVHSVLFLVLTFFTAAILWMTLDAEFLSIALVLVYVGAVMVLFLFVVMMINVDTDRLREGFWRYFPIGGAVALLMIIEMGLVLSNQQFTNLGLAEGQTQGAISNTRELGLVLYTDYMYPFELASVVLLLAIVSAIALTLRKRKDSSHIDPAVQVRVQAKDRLRIIDMKTTEKK